METSQSGVQNDGYNWAELFASGQSSSGAETAPEVAWHVTGYDVTSDVMNVVGDAKRKKN